MLRTVIVSLQDEATTDVMTWTAQRPADQYMAPALNAKTGTDVAIEELVLSIEDLVVE